MLHRKQLEEGEMSQQAEAYVTQRRCGTSNAAHLVKMQPVQFNAAHPAQRCGSHVHPLWEPLQCVYAAACNLSSAGLLLAAHGATVPARPSTGLGSSLDLLIDGILCLPRVEHAGKAVAVAAVAQICVLHLRQLVLHLRTGRQQRFWRPADPCGCALLAGGPQGKPLLWLPSP